MFNANDQSGAAKNLAAKLGGMEQTPPADANAQPPQSAEGTAGGGGAQQPPANPDANTPNETQPPQQDNSPAPGTEPTGEQQAAESGEGEQPTDTQAQGQTQEGATDANAEGGTTGEGEQGNETDWLAGVEIGTQTEEGETGSETAVAPEQFLGELSNRLNVPVQSVDDVVKMLQKQTEELQLPPGLEYLKPAIQAHIEHGVPIEQSLELRGGYNFNAMSDDQAVALGREMIFGDSAQEADEYVENLGEDMLKREAQKMRQQVEQRYEQQRQDAIQKVKSEREQRQKAQQELQQRQLQAVNQNYEQLSKELLEMDHVPNTDLPLTKQNREKLAKLVDVSRLPENPAQRGEVLSRVLGIVDDKGQFNAGKAAELLAISQLGKHAFERYRKNIEGKTKGGMMREMSNASGTQPKSNQRAAPEGEITKQTMRQAAIASRRGGRRF